MRIRNQHILLKYIWKLKKHLKFNKNRESTNYRYRYLPFSMSNWKNDSQTFLKVLVPVLYSSTHKFICSFILAGLILIMF